MSVATARLTAVFDSSVLVAGCGWRAESYLCLAAMARRRVGGVTSRWIIDEAQAALKRLQADGTVRHAAWPILHWFIRTAHHVEPAPLGKPRSRDPKDDPILGAALAGKAQFIISQDKDLLVLEKPFGVTVLTPRTFLATLQRPI